MGTGNSFASLLEEYEAAKREQLDAWSAIHAKGAAPASAEFERLHLAGMRRANIEEQLAELMADDDVVPSAAPEPAKDSAMPSSSVVAISLHRRAAEEPMPIKRRKAAA